MRRLFALLALVALAIAFAGCGGGHDKSAGPLDDALGYFPHDASFVAAVETNPNGSQLKQAGALLNAFPARFGLALRLEALTRFRYADWGRDVRPQLGNPLVIGLERARRPLGRELVLAIRVQHPLRAKQLILRQPGFRGHGKASGVRIFEDPQDNRYVAVDGNVLVAATDRATLESALATKRADARMRLRDLQHDVAGLGGDAVARFSADPRALLQTSARLRPALDVKWVDALRRLGGVISADGGGFTAALRAATDGAQLSNADLPLAPRRAALPLIGAGNELQVGVLDPRRLVRLAFAFWHASSPAKAAAFEALQPRGVDLERQIPHHLSGPAALALDPTTKAFAFRSLLTEPNDVQSALGTLAARLPALGVFLGIRGLGVASPAPGERFYALAKANGHSAVFGVAGNALVAATDARRAARLASASALRTAGLKGSAVVRVRVHDLATKFIARQLGGSGPFLAPALTRSLHDLVGSLTIDRSALRGRFRLAIR